MRELFAMRITVRACVPGDEALALGFVRLLADFEGLAGTVRATEEDIRRALFAGKCVGAAFAVAGEPSLIGESSPGAASREVGFALWYPTFSSFSGTYGLYLEDIYVDPSFRGKGVATALFDYLKDRARESGYDRIEWSVLAWNRGAKDFYRSIGGAPKDGWEPYRLKLT